MKDSGVEWIGEIPEDWNIRKLKSIITCRDGERVPIDSALRESGPYPYWGAGNITDYINNYLFDEELVLLGEDGAPFFDKKRNVAFLVKGKVWVNNHIHVLKADKEVISSYLVHFLNIVDFGCYINGSILNKLTQSNMNRISVAFPSKYEQQKIANFLDEKVGEIDSVIAKTKETIEDYKKYKQTIITDAVTKGLNPDVEMKESKTSYLGLIPAHWNEKRLRFLGMCQNGISKSSEYFGEGYPFVSYGDVYKNYTLPEMGSGLIKSSEEDRNIYSVQNGDVFFTRTSETIEEVGFASTCLKSIDNATFAGFVIRFRPNNQEELLPEFSKYYFRSDAHRKFFVKEMNLVTRASLSQELLKKLPVLLPPLEEQRKITEYLDEKCSEIDKLIAKKEELLADLESYKKSLIYEYVTGKKEVE